MKKTLLILVFVALLIIPLVQATDTTVVAKSLAGSNLSIMIRALDPEQGTEIETFEGYSNGDPSVSFTFSSSLSKVGIYAKVMSYGKILVGKNFGNYTTGTTINIDLFEGTNTVTTTPTPATITTTTNTTNSSSNSLNNSSNETTQSTNSISGNVIGSSNNETTVAEANSSSVNSFGPTLKKIGNIALIIVIIIVGLIILYFLGRFLISSIKKVSFKRTTEDVKIAPNPKIERELANAQRKIKEAQETIDNITNRKKKLTDAERRFEEAKRELERLKKD